MNGNIKKKVSILMKCAQKGGLEGRPYNSKIVLEILAGEYAVLAKILYRNVSLIHNLGVKGILKEELIRDARTIRTILEKSEKS